MQDIEGCSATPIDELFPVNRRRRKAPPENAQSIAKNSFRMEDRRDERSFLNHMPLPMVRIDILIFVSHYCSYCINFANSTAVAYKLQSLHTHAGKQSARKKSNFKERFGS